MPARSALHETDPPAPARQDQTTSDRPTPNRLQPVTQPTPTITPREWPECLLEGDGSTISLRYTNGLGIANNVKLRISPISEEKGAFANTTVVGPETGGTWTLAKDVLNGTKFHLNYRSAEKVQVDDHWEGELAW